MNTFDPACPVKTFNLRVSASELEEKMNKDFDGKFPVTDAAFQDLFYRFWIDLFEQFSKQIQVSVNVHGKMRYSVSFIPEGKNGVSQPRGGVQLSTSENNQEVFGVGDYFTCDFGDTCVRRVKYINEDWISYTVTGNGVSTLEELTLKEFSNLKGLKKWGPPLW